MKFNKYFDHTNLKPDATKDDIRTLCEEAKKNKISELYDSFEMTRKNTLEVFLSAGFSIVSYQKWLKSTAMVDGVVVKITL